MGGFDGMSLHGALALLVLDGSLTHLCPYYVVSPLDPSLTLSIFWPWVDHFFIDSLTRAKAIKGVT